MDVTNAEAVAWLQRRLTEDELTQLREQGFVHYENLPSGRPAAKLRFRAQGRQRVLYIGVDLELAQQIDRVVRQRQQPMRERRRLASLHASVRREFRRQRKRAVRELAAAGFYFHGYGLRRRRSGDG